jgi:hypothetical protein
MLSYESAVVAARASWAVVSIAIGVIDVGVTADDGLLAAGQSRGVGVCLEGIVPDILGKNSGGRTAPREKKNGENGQRCKTEHGKTFPKLREKDGAGTMELQPQS